MELILLIGKRKIEIHFTGLQLPRLVVTELISYKAKARRQTLQGGEMRLEELKRNEFGKR